MVSDTLGTEIPMAGGHLQPTMVMIKMIESNQQ